MHKKKKKNTTLCSSDIKLKSKAADDRYQVKKVQDIHLSVKMAQINYKRKIIENNSYRSGRSSSDGLKFSFFLFQLSCCCSILEIFHLPCQFA